MSVSNVKKLGVFFVLKGMINLMLGKYPPSLKFIVWFHYYTGQMTEEAEREYEKLNQIND